MAYKPDFQRQVAEKPRSPKRACENRIVTGVTFVSARAGYDLVVAISFLPGREATKLKRRRSVHHLRPRRFFMRGPNRSQGATPKPAHNEARRIAVNIAKLPGAIEPPADVGNAIRRGGNFQVADTSLRQAVSLSSWLQSGHRKMRISVSPPGTGTIAVRCISVAQRQSGSSVEPATSRRSNFDMTPPIPVGKCMSSS